MSASPARHLNLSGASNFRDLGGYPTSDGRTVR
jgi:protein-tyrosine phosphatase